MTIPHQKKFEARVDITLWDRYEEWAKGRGKIDNPQLLTGLLKLFLGMTESYQMMALFGKGLEFQASEGIHQTVLEALSAANDRRRAIALADPVNAIAEIVEPLSEADIGMLASADAEFIRGIKACLADSMAALRADIDASKAADADAGAAGERASKLRHKKARKSQARP